MMTSASLPYVDVRRDRNGRPTYWFFRRHGRLWRLPGQPLSEEFAVEYQRLIAYTHGLVAAAETANAPLDKRTYPPGTFGALVREYLWCARFKQLKPRTKAEYTRVLESLQRLHGDKRVANLRRRHIRKMRDERADTPGAANTILRMLKIVLNFAVEEEWIESNPAAKMQLLKIGEWRAWTDEECAAFEARWAPGTMQRRAYALAHLHRPAQERSCRDDARAPQGRDYPRRPKQDRRGVVDTRAPELTAELARGVSDHMSLLTTRRVRRLMRSISARGLPTPLTRRRLPEDCVLHGLRKTAARQLAEAGCTEQEIKAVTGHTTSGWSPTTREAADQEEASERRDPKAGEQQMNRIGKRDSERVANSWGSQLKIFKQYHGAPYGSRTRLFRLKI